MEKVIATIVIIVLTLGLISYAVIGQMGGFRDTADNVSDEQAKLQKMLDDSSVVPLNTVKQYVRNMALLGYKVFIGTSNTAATMADLDTYKDSAVFDMVKVSAADGSIDTITFTLISQAG